MNFWLLSALVGMCATSLETKPRPGAPLLPAPQKQG
jgi:hypothetical protein